MILPRCTVLSKSLLNHASSVISDTKIDELTQEVNKLSEKLDAKSYAEATRHSSPRGASRPSLPPPPPFEKQYDSVDLTVGKKGTLRLPTNIEEKVSQGLKALNITTLKFKRHSDTRASVLFTPASSRRKVIDFFLTNVEEIGVKLRSKEIKFLIHNVAKQSEKDEFDEIKQLLKERSLTTAHCRWLKASNFVKKKNDRDVTHSSIVLSLDAYQSDMEILSEIRRAGKIVIGHGIYSVSSYTDNPPVKKTVMSPTLDTRNNSNE